MAIPVVERKAQEYKTQDGSAPFRDWLFDLKDARAKAKITKAVTQMEAGNFGDHKPMAVVYRNAESIMALDIEFTTLRKATS